VGIVAAILVTEPAKADVVMERKAREGARRPLAAFFDATIGSLITFFRAHGWVMATLMLGMITLYHLCDYMRGPMTGPYYKALHIDNDVIAWTRLIVGTPGSFIGIAVGGICTVRFGNQRALIVGAIIQPIAIGAFALLGWHGGDFVLLPAGPVQISAFEAIMAFDSFAIGLSGVALVSYMSTLTSLGYTATQYALLTSALALMGKIAKVLSGPLVETLEHGRAPIDAYAIFYLLAAAVGLPAIVLCFVLARVTPAPARTRG
jgi:PAT family beta-lactamase induction signal transducer AmpG